MDAEQIARLIGELEDRVERLRALYEQYFMGIERIEPLTIRKDVDRRLWALRREQIRNTGLRFKLETTIQRYNTYQQYWQRIVREIEQGTYQRDLGRAAQRFGENAVTAFGRRRQRMFEKGLSKKAERDALRQTRESMPEIAADAQKEEAEPPSGDTYEVTFEEPVPSAAPFSHPPPLELEMDLGALPVLRDQPLSAVTADKPIPAVTPNKPVLALAPNQAIPAVPPSKAIPAVPLVRPLGAGPPNRPAAPAASAVGRPPTPAKLVGPAAPPQAVLPMNSPRAATAPTTHTSPASARNAPPAPPPRPPSPSVNDAALPARAAASPPAVPAVKGDDDTLSPIRLRQIYGAFVEAKRRANESTASVTYEKIAANLQNAARELRSKHKARSVDFEVVLKNGKPVLKPVVKG